MFAGTGRDKASREILFRPKMCLKQPDPTFPFPPLPSPTDVQLWNILGECLSKWRKPFFFLQCWDLKTFVKSYFIHTVMCIIKLNLFPVPVRLHSGSGKLIFRRYFNTFFIFKNVVHGLEPVETPSYSASHNALKYAQRS